MNIETKPNAHTPPGKEPREEAFFDALEEESLLCLNRFVMRQTPLLMIF